MLGLLVCSASLAMPVAGSSATGLRAGGPSASSVVPGDDWLIETPESHGMDPAILDQARTYAFTPDRNTQGVVVVHGGAIVAEWYAPGADSDSWGASWSVGKSFASALIGIAISEGKIPSVDVPMTTYFPEWAGTPRQSITLRHVLHMETGLDWLEDYDPSSFATSNIVAMVANQPDQLAYAASIAAAVAPGTWFNYSSGNSMLLSGVIEKATGMSAGDYARTKLLDPIGIHKLDWWKDAAGHTLTYCCVDTSSRNFARFGLLYLRGGTWGSTQVVPSSWVNASITDSAASYSGYGYQWWLDMSGYGSLPPFFSARGFDGQFIYVIPSLDLVVVRNGTYVKSPCPPVADPDLFVYYPPAGLVPGQGTVGPSIWDDQDFLGPIVDSFTAAPLAVRGSGIASANRRAGPAGDPSGLSASAAAAQATPPAPCPATSPSSTTTSVPASAGSSTTASSPGGSGAASGVVAVPRFTG